MKWCRHSTRLAIYLRDGLACVWCGVGAESGVSLTLDHLTPRADGGTNQSTNLVTACRDCNSARQDTPASAWAERWGRNVRSIRNHARTALDRGRARELLAARGSVAGAIEGARV